MKIKLLFAGTSPTYFCLPLIRELLNTGNFEIGILEFWNPGSKDPGIDGVDYYYFPGLDSYNAMNIIKAFFSKRFYSALVQQFNYRDQVHSNTLLKKVTRPLRIYNSQEIARKIFRKYNTISWHDLVPNYANFYKVIPESTRVISSTYSNDLFATTGKFGYSLLFDILQRSDIITCQRKFLKDIMLIKFGKLLEPKIKIITYGIPDEVFGLIDNTRQSEKIRMFMERYNIPSGKIKVMVGYSADRLHNTLDIIRELSKLDPIVMKRIFLLFPMSYGPDKELRNEVVEVMKSVDIEYKILEGWLTNEEIACLRLITDVVPFIPFDDGFSATLTETLYAGSIVISGSWLNYYELNIAGITYFQVNEPGEITSRMEIIIRDFEKNKSRMNENAEKIRMLTSFNSMKQGWIEILSGINRT